MILTRHLQTPWPVIWWDEIDSTSLEAARRAGNGETGPVWLAARTQSAGRGRLGRPWVSETGNLYTTALFPVQEISSELSCLPLAAGLAVRDLIAELSQGRVIAGLKWPNDVRVDERKLCGILMESGHSRGQSPWLSVGIGVNLAFAPEISAYETVSLKALVPEVQIDLETSLSLLDGFIRKRFQQQMSAGRSSIIADWMSATDQHGTRYKARIGGKEVAGEFAGLDEMGQLRLRTSSGEMVSVSAGDVTRVKEG
tara:strand:+ start:7823 stop:8587 length:765 start_codon:yes stop_codon:yes gene_type:complete